MRMADMSLLRIGLNVDIQRTDGRIHSAVISGVNQDTQSATVEWFEKGETKGKEIEAEAIFALNPNLIPADAGPAARDTATAKQGDEDDEEIDNGDSSMLDDDEEPLSTADSVCSEDRDTALPRKVKGRAVSTHSSVGRPMPPPSRRRSNKSSGGDGRENNSKPSNKARPRPSYLRQPQQAKEQNGQPEQPPQEPPKKVVPSAAAGSRRKSNVVKEIEKIKQKRDERRAVHQAIREHVEAEYDTSDPNWEFKAMIQITVLKKHNAAREVFNKLPADSIDVVYKVWHAKTGSTSLPPSDDNALREYMCMQAYLDAMESYNDWFSLYHHSKPTKPSSADVGSSFTDRVAQEHRMKQYQLDLEKWQRNLVRQTQITKDRIYNVLLFMDGGWMVDRFEDPEEEESRSQQLALLRQMHIPALCLNLHHMLHASQMYSECLQLADCIASEYHQLYKEFSKDDLKQLLRQIRESSLSLLDENKDPLGYELV